MICVFIVYNTTTSTEALVSLMISKLENAINALFGLVSVTGQWAATYLTLAHGFLYFFISDIEVYLGSR